MYSFEDVKSNLETFTCQHHHTKPFVSSSGDRINVLCCCNDFKAECKEKMIKMLGNEYIDQKINFF